MAVISNGVTVKTVTTFTPASWNGWPQPGISLRTGWPGMYDMGTYGEIYKRQPWVGTVVDKLAGAHARLPLKVYVRDDINRPEVDEEDPYRRLLSSPSKTIDPFLFYAWTRATRDVYGEAVWLKVRDKGGRPVELVPWHPTKLGYDADRNAWWLDTPDDGSGRSRVAIDRHDFVLFRSYNPQSLHRGLSRLERLRSTLENEDGARRANSAMWRNGGRPSVVLKHPMKFSDEKVVQRIRAQWEEVHGGVDNWAKAVVLEEGMDALALPLNAEDLQYIDGRKLNREEVCAVYDVPQPVVGILDHATFSNIQEQMRSMYRDTMAPTLKAFESTIQHELRDGTMGRDVAPDFNPDLYAEHLMDEVLRGDFEARAAAYQSAHWLTIAEIRKAENLPFIPGTDKILVNSAMIPLDMAGKLTGAASERPPVPADAVRALMGRLGRLKSLDDLDLSTVTGPAADLLLAALPFATDPADLRARVLELTRGDA